MLNRSFSPWPKAAELPNRNKLLLTAPGFQNTLCRCRVLQQLPWRTDGAGREIAAAVRANTVQLGVHAVNTERTLISADTCIFAVGRKVTTTAFTIGSDFEHGCCSYCLVRLRSSSYAAHFSRRAPKMVRPRGLEPPRVSPLPPQGSASTNSATAACHLRMSRR